LVLIFDEGVLFIKLNLLSFILAAVGPRIVNFLGLLHQLLDTVYGSVIIGLEINRVFADGLEIEQVGQFFFLIFGLSLVNEDFVVEFLDFEVKRVVRLGDCHE